MPADSVSDSVSLDQASVRQYGAGGASKSAKSKVSAAPQSAILRSEGRSPSAAPRE